MIVEFPEIDPFLAEVGRVDVEAFQHQFNRLGRGGLVLNQQNAHASLHHPRA